MEYLKTAALSICTALVSLGLISVLVPAGKNKKTISAVFGICTVLAVVMPLSGGLKFGFSISSEEALTQNTSLEQTVNEQILDLSAQQVEISVQRALSKAGYDNLKISVFMDISEQDSIFIECVSLEGELTQEEQEEAVLTVASLLGLEADSVEVKNNG